MLTTKPATTATRAKLPLGCGPRRSSASTCLATHSRGPLTAVAQKNSLVAVTRLPSDGVRNFYATTSPLFTAPAAWWRRLVSSQDTTARWTPFALCANPLSHTLLTTRLRSKLCGCPTAISFVSVAPARTNGCRCRHPARASVPTTLAHLVVTTPGTGL